MIRAYVAGDELSGLAEELYQELEPRMIAAAEAGADVYLSRVRRLLSRQEAAGISAESRTLMKGAKNTGERMGMALVASRPPLYREGDLFRSIRRLKTSKMRSMIRSRVGVWDDSPAERSSKARKAAALEYGGTDRKGRYHPPYPFMRPAEIQAREEVQAVMDAELEKPL